MENELPVPHTSSSACATSSTSGASSSSGCNNSSSGGSGRPTGPQISVYSGIPDRQTVQVIQQALHRQPSTAAQYLQQMYAAQQQHLMLQTAALQQQHLSSAQLQSLAAVQQASLVANRQGSTSGSNVSAQAPAQSSSINLAASPAAAQLLNRAQSVNSAAASGIAQQAVLLGNTSSPALTASQAQMYLRAQMLIFTPTATVATVQPELGTGSPARPPTPAQVQNLTLRTQQTPAAAASGPTPTQPVLPSLALKPTPGSSQPLPTPAQSRNTAQASPAGAKPGIADSVMEPLKKGDGNSSVPGSMEGRAGLSRTVPAVAAHPLIAPAYAQLQPHQLLPQPSSKHLQPQFVIQQQPQPQQQQPPPQPSRPGLQAQPHPQLASVSPSVALQPSSEAHAMPLGPVTPALPLQCPTANLHKAGGSQQCHPPTPDAGPQNGHPEGVPHTPQRRFQHTSAVILQLQPASPVPQQCVPDDWKEAAPGEKSVPETRSGPSPHQQAIVTAMPGGLPVPKSPNIQPSPAHETGQGIVHALTDLSSPGMTSGNGNSASSIAGTAPQNGENKPPQAIVKPQILTHVIEGFVIQEGAEPFPVGRSSLLVGNLKKKYAQGFLPEKLPQQDHTTTTDSEMEEPYLQESKEEGAPLKLKCELCGRVDFAYKFKRSKRFCSMACAKRYNVGCTKRVGLFHSDRSKLQKAGAATHNRRRASKASLPPLTKDTKKQPTGTVPLSVTAALQLTHSQEDSSRCSDNSSYEEPLSPISASSSTSRRRQGQRDLELPDMHMRDLVGMGHHFLPSEPTKWNVEDVYEFIRSLPGLPAASPKTMRLLHTVSQSTLDTHAFHKVLPAPACGQFRGHTHISRAVLWQHSFSRLPGDSRGIPCPGNRRASPAAAQGGPPDERHEHQAGACPEDLRPHQHAQGLLGPAAARMLAQGAASRLRRARQTFLRGPEMGPVGGQGLSLGA
ncbi:PREDICTED: polyhomeotic-like protein 2 isoform X4 [Rhinopithecus bieti]|uniref:polyhomeotic-like protein 2 isoform X4 n=1 Tax=Rhinopithecus bieti TaxID=61621 RepID=UPI00083BD997|nr:PREDICTED: polyhomeotic-like protein 2 isoform X4 [Rhinopithecus bieti]XP_017740008.1 PREDICTED: polyhomeotic-like protein 2 isoform X4 [Rhinopithecus bieti]